MLLNIYLKKTLITDSYVQFSSVQSLSHVRLCNPMNCSTPGLPVHHQLLEFTQTHVHWVDDAIQPSHPLSSPSPPAFNLSQHQGLLNKSALRIRWPKYWSFSFNISPSNELLCSLQYIYIYNHIFFMHLSIHGYLDCFHSLIIVYIHMHTLAWYSAIERIKSYHLLQHEWT